MSDKNTILPEQCRAARALLGWARDELSSRASVSMATLADFETGKRRPYDRTLSDIRAALEAGGVAFVDQNGMGPGVRLRDRTTTE